MDSIQDRYGAVEWPAEATFMATNDRYVSGADDLNLIKRALNFFLVIFVNTVPWTMN